MYTKQKLDLKDLGEHFHFDWVKMGLHRNCTVSVSVYIEQKSSRQPKEDMIFESALGQPYVLGTKYFALFVSIRYTVRQSLNISCK